jgi:hypothetical protein
MAFDWIKDWPTDKLRSELSRLEASPALRLTVYRDAVLAELKRRSS